MERVLFALEIGQSDAFRPTFYDTKFIYKTNPKMHGPDATKWIQSHSVVQRGQESNKEIHLP